MRLTFKRVVLPALVAIAAGACGSSAPKAPPSPSTWILSGTLQDGSGHPLGQAGVALVGSPLGGMSDREGAFRVTGIPARSYQLAVIYLGYRSRGVPLPVTGEEPVKLVLPMSRDASLGPALADSMGAITVLYTLRPASGS